MTTLDQVKELDDLNKLVGDEDLEHALNILLKLIAKPDVPPQMLGPMIVQLQAISAKLNMMASIETHLYKENRARKNVLYSTKESLDLVVQALKYLSRT